MIYIVMRDFQLFNRRYHAGDFFDESAWSPEMVEGLLLIGRIDVVQVEDESEIQDENESYVGSSGETQTSESLNITWNDLEADAMQETELKDG